MHSSSCSHFLRGVSLWTRSYRQGKEMHPPIRRLLSRSAGSPAKITSGFCHWDVSARKPRHQYLPMSRRLHQVHKTFFSLFNPGEEISMVRTQGALPIFPRIACRPGTGYQGRFEVFTSMDPVRISDFSSGYLLHDRRNPGPSGVHGVCFWGILIIGVSLSAPV